MEQGTQEWHDARCGKITASRIADVMAKTKSGYAASRKNYMAQLVVERMTGVPADSGFVNAAMQWGTDTEPYAREAYELMAGELVKEVGFVEHEAISAGASPDGLVGDDGLIEIKCPNTATHIETLLNNKIDNKYILQMHWQMICTHRKWCDFVSYDPRMPEGLKYWCQRVERDSEIENAILDEVIKFDNETIAKVQSLKKLAA